TDRHEHCAERDACADEEEPKADRPDRGQAQRQRRATERTSFFRSFGAERLIASRILLTAELRQFLPAGDFVAQIERPARLNGVRHALDCFFRRSPSPSQGCALCHSTRSPNTGFPGWTSCGRFPR